MRVSIVLNLFDEAWVSLGHQFRAVWLMGILHKRDTVFTGVAHPHSYSEVCVGDRCGKGAFFRVMPVTT